MAGREFTIAAPRLLLDGRLVGPGAVAIEGGRIRRVLANAPARPDILMPDILLQGGVLTPGLIDTQNNGAFGVDFAAAEGPDWPMVLRGLARRGVTAVLPTIITAPLPAILEAMARIESAVSEAGARRSPEARILGVHLEGPFIAEARKGAHRAEWMRDPNPQAIDALLTDAPTRRMLRMITLAPERAHAPAAIARLAGAGVVVSIGHSDATATDALRAADAGASMVTHLFNAMRPFGHRDPALPGVALTDSRLFVGLIVDGHHVDPIGCRLAFQAAGARIVAVSDSILVAGLEAGCVRQFGGAPVRMDPDGVGRRPDGTIAGAGIVLDEGIRRMIAAGIDPALVLTAATETPARAIRSADRGRLSAGAHADLVWWDEGWRPRRIWIGGQEEWGQEVGGQEVPAGEASAPDQKSFLPEG